MEFLEIPVDLKQELEKLGLRVSEKKVNALILKICAVKPFKWQIDKQKSMFSSDIFQSFVFVVINNFLTSAEFSCIVIRKYENI